jgi:hypothetical protein
MFKIPAPQKGYDTDGTIERNSEISGEEIEKMRKETEGDDEEIYCQSFGFGVGVIRLCVVIAKNSDDKYSLIHYQLAGEEGGKWGSNCFYVVDYKKKEIDIKEMMGYCLKYPYHFYAVRF